MVCSITRGPAKPISATRFRDVNVSEHGIRSRHATGGGIGEDDDIGQLRIPQALATATVVRGICISDMMPSCMRAPPDETNKI